MKIAPLQKGDSRSIVPFFHGTFKSSIIVMVTTLNGFFKKCMNTKVVFDPENSCWYIFKVMYLT